MQSLQTYITTAPRPVPTFERSFASFRDAGFGEHTIVLADGVEIAQPERLVRAEVIKKYPALGGFRAWAHALELGVLSSKPWILIAEDDIEWAGGAAMALEGDLARVDTRNLGYLSLFCARRVSHAIEFEKKVGRGGLRPGFHENKLGWNTWGSQALVLSHESATALLTNDRFNWYRDNYTKNRNRDAIVSDCFKEMRRKMLFRLPCLVAHTYGQGNSSLGPKPEQPGLLCDYWNGRP